MRNNKERNIYLKRFILIISFAFIGIGFLYLVLLGITELFLNDKNTDVTSSDISFFEADYNENIFENEFYISRNRNIYYLQYGSGEILTEDNIYDFPAGAKLFYNYFKTVINGDYNKYKSFFTDNYIENNDLPEPFTMQKIYDIEVNLFDKQVKEEDSNKTTVETYIVEYKIMENNGTFRNDVGSNTNKPLVFTLYINGDSVLINSISNKTNKN